MNETPSVSFLGLRDEDAAAVRAVLKDVRKSVRTDIGIGGSLAQRALSAQIEESLRGTPLNDVDLLLLGSQDVETLLPSLEEDFRVVEKSFGTGWYAGLVHKATQKPVDLFTPDYVRPMTDISIDGVSYPAESIETQALYLARDILRRATTGFPVRQKWLDKLSALCALPFDGERMDAEFGAQAGYFRSVWPKKKLQPDNANAYLAGAMQQRITSALNEWFFLRWYFLKMRFKAVMA